MGNVLARRKAPRPSLALDSRGHYPQASELCLFDFPALIRGCINVLRANGIGRVYLKCLLINQGKWQLHIQYFHTLDHLNAEQFSTGYDDTGHYACYRLFVNADIDVVWTKGGRS